jgi:hypothetical protein
MQQIEIYDQDTSGALAFDLKDILQLLEPKRPPRSFLLDLEALGDANTLQLERRIAASARGIELGWEDIISIANKITQTIDMTLVGVSYGAPRRAFP